MQRFERILLISIVFFVSLVLMVISHNHDKEIEIKRKEAKTKFSLELEKAIQTTKDPCNKISFLFLKPPEILNENSKLVLMGVIIDKDYSTNYVLIAKGDILELWDHKSPKISPTKLGYKVNWNSPACYVK